MQKNWGLPKAKNLFPRGQRPRRTNENGEYLGEFAAKIFFTSAWLLGPQVGSFDEKKWRRKIS
jgi:hypothetical protein